LLLNEDDEFCELLGWLLLPNVEDCDVLGDCELLVLSDEPEPCVLVELMPEFCELDDVGEDEVLFMVELEPGDVDVPDEDCVELLEVWA